RVPSFSTTVPQATEQKRASRRGKAAAKSLCGFAVYPLPCKEEDVIAKPPSDRDRRTANRPLRRSREHARPRQTILKSHKAEIVKVAEPVVRKKRALRDAVIAAKPDEKAIRAAAVLASKIKVEV